MITFKEYLKEVLSDRWAAVDPVTNMASYIDSDRKTVERVAKKKGHELRHIFGPKYGHMLNAIKLKVVK